jgi:hypothetical protein
MLSVVVLNVAFFIAMLNVDTLNVVIVSLTVTLSIATLSIEQCNADVAFLELC